MSAKRKDFTQVALDVVRRATGEAAPSHAPKSGAAKNTAPPPAKAGAPNKKTKS
jgi:hypothetical protein